MQKQMSLLGALHIAGSILYALIATATLAILSSTAMAQGDGMQETAYRITATVAAWYLIALSAAGVTAGIGIMHGWHWANTAILILGCMDLVMLPFWTLLGIYTIWVVMKEAQSAPGPDSAITQAIDRKKSFPVIVPQDSLQLTGT
jgi:hypothetical protein